MAEFNPDEYLAQKPTQQPTEQTAQQEFNPNAYLGIAPRTMGQELSRQVGLTGRAAYEGFTAPATLVLEGTRTLYNLFAPEGKKLPSVAESQSKML